MRFKDRIKEVLQFRNPGDLTGRCVGNNIRIPHLFGVTQPVFGMTVTNSARPTPYDINTPITLRLYFIEDSGQLCQECYSKLYGKAAYLPISEKRLQQIRAG